MTDTIRVMRVLVYEGPRDWVEKTVSNSITGTKMISGDRKIHGSTIGLFPEILEQEDSEEDSEEEGES